MLCVSDQTVGLVHQASPSTERYREAWIST